MKRWIIGSLSLLAVVCCTASPLLADDSKSLIADGDRIGQVRLGMGEEELEKLLGKPSKNDASMGRGVETWSSKSADGRTEQTEVAIHRDSEGQHWNVTQIAVTSPFFRTRGGNSTNSDLDAIWREYPDLRYLEGNIDGEGSHLEIYDSISSGIALLIEHNHRTRAGEPWGKCLAIIVHPRGQEASTMAGGTLMYPPSGG